MAKKKKKDSKAKKSGKKKLVANGLIASIQKVHIMYERRLDSAFNEFNLSNEQYRILKHLNTADNTGYSLRQVRENLPNQTSNATRLVEKLHQKKYVSKKANPKDKRELRIQITTEGQSTLASANQEIKSLNEQVQSAVKGKNIKTINKELSGLVNLLDENKV